MEKQKFKIKHTTLCNNYDNGGLKNVCISPKIKKLQYYNTTPSWKVTPLHLIKTNLELNFKFHSNLSISVQKLKSFLPTIKLF